MIYYYDFSIKVYDSVKSLIFEVFIVVVCSVAREVKLSSIFRFRRAIDAADKQLYVLCRAGKMARGGSGARRAFHFLRLCPFATRPKPPPLNSC